MDSTARVVWLSDLHFDHSVGEGRHLKLIREVVELKPDVVLIGGDTSLAGGWEAWVTAFSEVCVDHTAVLFVLGNHDYWGGSIAEVEESARDLVTGKWLDTHGPYWKNTHPIIPILGVGGWGDGLVGLGADSMVRMNDWWCIAEFAVGGGPARMDHIAKMCAGLGEIAAERLHEQLWEVYDAGVRQAIVLTHVPPWQEAAWYAGKPSDPHYAPWFVCKQVGDLLDSWIERGMEFLVLCGHTHGEGLLVRDGLVCKTARAQYGRPRIAGVFDIGEGWKIGDAALEGNKCQSSSRSP